MRFVKRNSLIHFVYHSAVSYKPPITLNYFWNFGVLALFCLVLQLATGIFLAMHYVASPEHAFNSVEHIMRDVNYGWLLRYLHANGASMFFLVVYVHMFRGLYYGSYMYPRQILSQTLALRRVARPRVLSDSCVTIGIFNLCAAYTTGTDTKPPLENTTSTLLCLRSFLLWW